ncbi:MAG: patatin-like phospholipase family protein [Desulfobacteraceae bacterium]|nr:MAG: patatin-like phospholipase family protein [Desulfobacteraceae bacterium]
MGWKRKRLGLALGGGGARGIAHVGVLRVFEEESIPVDLIVGTSIGALVGAAYSTGQNTYEMEKRIEEFLNSPTFQESALKDIKEIQDSKKSSFTGKIHTFLKNRFLLAKSLFRLGMLKSKHFQAMIDFFVPDIQIQDTQIPYRAVATDFVSGQSVVMSEGPLRRAVMASCAVPGAVPPIEVNGMLLSDGGSINVVPTTVAREEGADFVVAVSVRGDIHSDDELGSAVDICLRAADIMGFHFETYMLDKADVVIHPQVGSLHWTEFAFARDLVREGERAAREKLHLLRKALPPSRRWKILSSLLKFFKKNA